ncbi:MAG: 1-acyl-sn-glycerol-3-phosphate acyltransferase [Spirochaetaceae bacterium]|jgi:1-acyl-sn-glycerol-3-phosphate acyltransferase|nr:1-acyl-sn-glycerol-3-phosphate acyltransferase [Spirochaetaceae bacterium]
MTQNDMPKIKNYPLYIYRVFVKWISFFIFGFGTVLIGLLLFPVMSLFVHPEERFKKKGRAIISAVWYGFCKVMCFLGGVAIELDNKQAYKNLSSKIIVANHPSLLDVVMIISLIPNADCIVNASLKRNIVNGVIRRIYISNSLEFSELSARCKKTLDEGNCLVIFPEGSRTPRTGHLPLKRGAARISVLTQNPIIPIRIGGNDKWGLGKHDPWTAYNHSEKYIYKISMLDEISPEKYSELPVPIATRRITEDLEKLLF